MAAHVVLLAALVVLAGAEGDALVLVQRSLRSNEVGSWRSRLSRRTSSFRVGDHLEFRVTATKWVNCTVLSESHDAFTIHVPAFPPGHQDVPDVGVSSLRDPRKEEARIRLREEAKRLAENEVKRREEEESQMFEDWEDVLLAGQNKAQGRWFPARILSRGDYPGTYDVRFNGQRFRNVRTRMLRKTHTTHFDICEQVEVRDANGTWLRSKVLGLGSDVGLLNIRFPGSKDKELQDIPILALRKVNLSADTNASEAANPSGAANATEAANAGGASQEGAAAEEVHTSEAGGGGAAFTDSAAEGGASSAAPVEVHTFEANASSAAFVDSAAEGGASSAAPAEVAEHSQPASEEKEPEPTYEAGQQLLVQLYAGRGTKPWVSCTVVGPSGEPGMYHVRVDARMPAYDICDVSVDRLREPEEVVMRKAEAAARLKEEADTAKAAAAEQAKREEEEQRRKQEEEDKAKQEAETRAKEEARREAVRKVQASDAYAVGQKLQFNHQGSRWVNCTVISLGLKPDEYSIHVPSFPQGLQEIHEVRAQALRSPEDIEQRRAEAVRAKRKAAEEAAVAFRRAHNFEPEERVQVKGTNGDWANAVVKAKDPKPNWYSINVGGQTVKVHNSVLRRDREHEFEDGESVEIRSKEFNNAWVPCTVLRRGALPNTYNVYFPHGRVGHRDMHNIDSRALRRTKFLLGQGVEVFMPISSDAGIWVEGNITSTTNITQDIYDVRISDDSAQRNLSSVPYKRLRQSEAANAAYREQLRLQAEERRREQEREERRANVTRDWLAEHTFQDGESVQVRGSGAATGTWVNVTILGKGTKPHCYNLAWRNGIVFKDVERRNLRKDRETQEAKERAAAEVVKRLQEEEAARLAKIKADVAAEEARARAREAGGNASALDAEVRPKEVAEVEVVSDEKLKELVEQTRFVEQMRQALLEAQERERQLTQPKSANNVDEEDVQRRQAEWEAALKAEEESQAGNQEEETKQQELQLNDDRLKESQAGNQEEETKLQELQLNDDRQKESHGGNEEVKAQEVQLDDNRPEESQGGNQEEETKQQELQLNDNRQKESQGGNEEVKVQEVQLNDNRPEEHRQQALQERQENLGGEVEELS